MGGDGIARRRSNGAASTSNEPDRAASWDRVLYRKQAFPDNHTDDTFLSGLVLNGRITPRVLSEVMLDAATVSQQLAVVALKSTAVAHLLSGRVTARSVVPGGDPRVVHEPGERTNERRTPNAKKPCGVARRKRGVDVGTARKCHVRRRGRDVHEVSHLADRKPDRNSSVKGRASAHLDHLPTAGTART